MSKRHRKAKDMLSSQRPNGAHPEYGVYDPDMFEAPKGKKPKGKHRRESHKHKVAYYD